MSRFLSAAQARSERRYLEALLSEPDSRELDTMTARDVREHTKRTARVLLVSNDDV